MATDSELMNDLLRRAAGRQPAEVSGASAASPAAPAWSIPDEDVRQAMAKVAPANEFPHGHVTQQRDVQLDVDLPSDMSSIIRRAARGGT